MPIRPFYRYDWYCLSTNTVVLIELSWYWLSYRQMLLWCIEKMDVLMPITEAAHVDAISCLEKRDCYCESVHKGTTFRFLNACLNCTSAEYRYLYRIFEVWSVSAWRRRAATARRAAVSRADRQDLGGDGNNGREIWYAGTRAKYRSARSRWTRKRKLVSTV